MTASDGRTTDTTPDLDVAFARARPRLLGVATSLVGPTAAEDAVHDTYLAARAAWPGLRDRAAVDAWLQRICIHRCFRVHRRQRLLRRILPILAERSTAASRTGATRGSLPGPDLDLRELVERLPSRERAVIVLHYGHGYSFAEVAELVGISHDNARAIASRARRRLLEAWLEADR